MNLHLENAPEPSPYVYTDHLGSRPVEITYTEPPRSPESARGSWPVYFDPLKDTTVGVYYSEGTFTKISA